MTVVNPKSISGINSITTGSGSDDILTIHTNNGTERLRVDSTGATKIVTGIVTTLTATTGIVTTLTASTVTSLGDVSIADKIVHTGDTDTAIRFSGADTITAETGGSERARIDSSGRLLLGTTTEGHASADDLTIATSASTGLTIRSGTSNEGNIYFSDGTSGSGEYAGAISYNHSANSLNFYANSTNRANIDSGGNFQISVGNLKISNDIKSSDDDFYVYSYKGGSDGQVRSGIQYDGNSQRLRFFTGTNERLRVKSNGQIILGNVSNTGGVSNSTLHIESGGMNVESQYDTDDLVGSPPHLTLSGQSTRVRMDMGTMSVSPYAGWIQARYDNHPFGNSGTDDGLEPLVLNPVGGALGINVHDADALNNIGAGMFAAQGGIVIRAGRANSTTVNNASTAIKIFPGEVRAYSGSGNVGEQNQGTKYGGIAWNVLDPQNGGWGGNHTGHHCWMGMSLHSTPAQEKSNWQVQMNSNSTGGSFATNVAIQANPEGWVTTPNNPSFCAIKNSSHYYFTSGQRTIITGWSEHHDTHLDFNPSTGVFTAPIKGTYYFYVSVMQDRNDAGDFQLSIHKNTNMYVNSNDLSNSGSTSVVFQQTTVNAIVNLEKNDTVDFRGYNSTSTSSFIYRSSYTHCGGYLIG